MKHASPAFSLLEISVVLVIIALVIGGGVSMGIGQLETAREAQTRDKMEIIRQALQNYANAYHNIPCPALPEIPIGTLGYGEAADASKDCDGIYMPTARNLMGALPTRNLGLPDDMMYDGWGRRFTFVHGRQWSMPIAFNPYTMEPAFEENLTVNSGNADITNSAVYILISHGPNGHGAYLRNGTVFVSNSENIEENYNCKCDASGARAYDSEIFYSRLPSVDSSAANNNFDDIVIFQTYPQMNANAQ